MPNSSILTKTMALIDLVAASHAPLTLGEITDRCGLPKSSTHRLLVLLRDERTLAYDAERQTYSPGARLMRWGVQTQRRANLAIRAAPHMNDLCRQTGMRAALSVLDQNAVLFVHTVETGAPFRLAPRIGEHSPLHASAAGKVFLAGMPENDRQTLLAAYEFEQCTEFTITNIRQMLAEIELVARQGFAISAREEFRQTSGVAVPIFTAAQKTVAALSLWNVGDAKVLETLLDHRQSLVNAATDIQLSFGHDMAN